MKRVVALLMLVALSCALAEERGPETRALTDELVREIHRGAPEMKLTDGALAVLRKVAGTQDEKAVIGALLQEYDKPHGLFVVRNLVIIKALQQFASPDAKAALLRLALSDDRRTTVVEARAAMAFVALTRETAEILKLLDGPEEGVVCVGLRALEGASLDRAATVRLTALLKSDKLLWHNLVSTAFATDRSQESVGEKVAALLDAAGRLEGLPGWDKTAPQSRWSHWEEATRSYVCAMSKMAGADGVLCKRLAAAEGRKRELIVMALAARGQREVHDELLAMVKTAKDGLWRTMAVESLRSIATDADGPLLAELRKSDPFLRPDRSHPAPTDWIGNYPVRHAAHCVLLKLGRQ